MRLRVLEQLAKDCHAILVFSVPSSLVQEPKSGCELREREHEQSLGLAPQSSACTKGTTRILMRQKPEEHQYLRDNMNL